MYQAWKHARHYTNLLGRDEVQLVHGQVITPLESIKSKPIKTLKSVKNKPITTLGSVKNKAIKTLALAVKTSRLQTSSKDKTIQDN